MSGLLYTCHVMSFRRRRFTTVGCTDASVPSNTFCLTRRVADYLPIDQSTDRCCHSSPPVHSLSSTVSYTFYETYHHTAFNVVMWLPHHVSKVSQLARLNVTQQLVFRSSHPVNLRCGHQLRPRYSQQHSDALVLESLYVSFFLFL